MVTRPGFHDLRRYDATALVADGVDLRTLMNRMGHKTATLALDVYAQPNPNADRSTVARRDVARESHGEAANTEPVASQAPEQGEPRGATWI